MFTVLTVMAAENITRAGFCKTVDAARPNQTFEEGVHFAWRNPCDVDFSIRLTEVTPT